MINTTIETRKFIQLHRIDKEVMVYKVYGYNQEYDSLCSAFYAPAKNKMIGPGWQISDRIFGFVNHHYDNDFPIKRNNRIIYHRIDKGIHVILNKEDTEMYEIFPSSITVPVFGSPLDVVVVDEWSCYAVFMKVLIKDSDYEKALSDVKEKIERFKVNFERMTMR